MTRRSKIILWVVSAVILSALLAGFLLPLLPASYCRRTTGEFCLKCGVRRWTTETWRSGPADFVVKEVRIEETPLSKWYQEHFGKDCPHEWQWLDRERTEYWRVFGSDVPKISESGEGRRPRLLRLNDQDRKILDEKFSADREACRKYIEDALRPSTQAQEP